LATVAVRAAVVVAATELGGLLSVTVIGALGAAMVIDAVADFVESVTEVAVTVTAAGLGAEAGALYFVAAPLAVDAAEKLPHGELPQLTVHVTPALAVSLLTIAVRLVLVPASSDGGGCVENETEIDAGGLGEDPDPPQPVINNRRTKIERMHSK
jgi:hypothetical protein